MILPPGNYHDILTAAQDGSPTWSSRAMAISDSPSPGAIPVATSGDGVEWTGAAEAVGLDGGSDGQVLTRRGAGYGWEDPHGGGGGVSVHSHVLPSMTATVQNNTATFRWYEDVDGFHSGAGYFTSVLIDGIEISGGHFVEQAFSVPTSNGYGNNTIKQTLVVTAGGFMEVTGTWNISTRWEYSMGEWSWVLEIEITDFSESWNNSEFSLSGKYSWIA